MQETIELAQQFVYKFVIPSRADGKEPHATTRNVDARDIPRTEPLAFAAQHE